jgi:hypothetical protein
MNKDCKNSTEKFGGNMGKTDLSNWRNLLLKTALGFFLSGLMFYFIQNHLNLVGGSISLPKALWLQWALFIFFAVPFFMWHDPKISLPWRKAWCLLSLNFVIRGAAELFLIYGARGWDCFYGIGHDLFSLFLAFILILRMHKPKDSRDRLNHPFIWIYGVTLIMEAWNAWQFSLLANPTDGIYFAAGTESFRFVNLTTIAFLVLSYGMFFVWLMQMEPSSPSTLRIPTQPGDLSTSTS